MMNETDKARSIEIANIILSQMGGGGRIRAMTGAKRFEAVANGLQFDFPNRQRSRGNRVRVVLDPSDTYTVTFFNASRAGTKVVKEVSDIYCDSLKELFERQTGLYLSL